jgi:hypothetical protein
MLCCIKRNAAVQATPVSISFSTFFLTSSSSPAAAVVFKKKKKNPKG